MSKSRLLRMEKLQLGRVNAFMHGGTMHCKGISWWTMSFEIQEKIELDYKEFWHQWRSLRLMVRLSFLSKCVGSRQAKFGATVSPN